MATVLYRRSDALHALNLKRDSEVLRIAEEQGVSIARAFEIHEAIRFEQLRRDRRLALRGDA